MGFLIFIPFLIIDLVVSSTLMSMGMVMLPPTMIALPFKIMMFVLVDGWSLVIKTLVVIIAVCAQNGKFTRLAGFRKRTEVNTWAVQKNI